MARTITIKNRKLSADLPHRFYESALMAKTKKSGLGVRTIALILKILALIIAFGHGAGVAAAVAVFISVLGIAPQLAAITGTRDKIRLYAYCLLAGIFIAGAAELLGIRGHLGKFGEILFIGFEFLWGMFTGILLSALAEAFNVMPSLSTVLGKGTPMKLAIIVFAIGKTIGSIVYWMTPYFP